MKTIAPLALLLALLSPAAHADATPCAEANTKLAQAVLQNAAERIGFSASQLGESESPAPGVAVFKGYIYRASYQITIKTDSGCMPSSISLAEQL